MSTVELLQHQERACWAAFSITRSDDDLRIWRKALQQLHDEIEHRQRLLIERAEGQPCP